MYEKKKKAPVVNIGSSMLLVIFLILCLVMFATLSVTTARSNYLLSQREAQRLTQKTEADNTSEELLGKLDTLLQTAEPADSSGTSGEAQANGVSSCTAAASVSGSDIDVSIQQYADGHLQFSWQIPFSDTQALAVTVVAADAGNLRDYTITKWQTVQTRAWTATDTINVMTP